MIETSYLNHSDETVGQLSLVVNRLRADSLNLRTKGVRVRGSGTTSVIVHLDTGSVLSKPMQPPNGAPE
jgi:hypothetical protein